MCNGMKTKLIAIILLLLPISTVFAEDSLISVSGKNNSYETSCAEEDNINIPFIGEADSIIISATHPSSYQVETYTCIDDTTGCDFDDDEEYEFENPTDDDGINMYDDGEIYLVVHRQATWWRPTGMQVWVDDNDYNEYDIHYIEIGQKIEDSDNEFPIFFVLYEDGYLRLIPHPPENIDYTCFGSSVLIGSAEISSRPYADIESLHFISLLKTIEISYSNGDQYNIILEKINRTEAEIKVEVNERNEIDTPFATFRSMYVTEGKADVGKVKVTDNDETQEYNILSFIEDEAPNWFFFRSIASQHNQSAPDIEITFYKTEGDDGTENGNDSNDDETTTDNGSNGSCFIGSIIRSVK